MRTEVSKILWAVDPFEPDLSLDEETLRDFERWTKESNITVEPVYVFTPIGKIEGLAAEKIASEIAELFAKLEITIKKPKVLIRYIDSTKRQAMHLLDYASKSGADLIVVSSHGRKGFARMLFGSFAETLLNTSDLPLLFMNKNPRPLGAKFENVLWATDFSKSCRLAYRAFLSQAHGICKDLILFHDVSLPLELSLYFSQWDVGVPPMDDLIEGQTIWAKQQSSRWLEQARKMDFKVQISVAASRGAISNEIIAAARDTSCGMIAMASQMGPVGSMLLGSYARQVFRASEFPIWIYGSQFFEAAKRRQKSEAAKHFKTKKGATYVNQRNMR